MTTARGSGDPTTRRRRRLVLLSAAALLTPMLAATAVPPASAASTAGCGKSPSLSSGTRTITSGGQSRSYILRIPSGYDQNRPYRLIFAFHWLGGTASNVANDYYGLLPLSNNSAIFVAPQGIDNGWPNPNGRDVTFTDDMLAQLSAALCIDTTQVFSLGFSYGGGMSYALACARANVFRAVAVYSGGVISGCSGGTLPIAYLGVHGVSDTVLNISGGRQMRDRFVSNNHCAAQSPREPSPGSGQYVVTAYTGCTAGYPVTWAAFDGGHTGSPGSWLPPLTWQFFTQFPSGTTTTTTTTRTSTTTTGTTTSTTSTTTRTTTSSTTTDGGTGGCSASFTTESAWGGGFVGNVRVTANQALSGWQVTVNLPGGVQVVGSWNATLSGNSGTVTASNASYNGNLAAGQSTSFGFQANGAPNGITVSCSRA